MKLSRVAGRGLKEMAKGLRSLSNGAHQTDLQKQLGKDAVELVREGIHDGRAPEGDAWPKRTDGALALQPLASTVEYRPLPPNEYQCAVEVRVTHWTSHFAQRGTLQDGVVHNPEGRRWLRGRARAWLRSSAWAAG